MFGKSRLSLDSIAPLPLFFVALQIPFLACLQAARAGNFTSLLLSEIAYFTVAFLVLGPFFVLFALADGQFKETHQKGHRDRQRMGFWRYSTSTVLLITALHLLFYSGQFYTHPPSAPSLLIYPHYLFTALIASFCVSLFHLTCISLTDRHASRLAGLTQRADTPQNR